MSSSIDVGIPKPNELGIIKKKKKKRKEKLNFKL